MLTRCDWCGVDPLYIAYHDNEWGVPLRDDQRLFEMLILEGAQAGLSWLTILKKRNNYRRAFDNFDPQKISRYTQEDINRLLQDPGIVRNRLKIEAAIKNARGYLKILDDHKSFSDYLWTFVDGEPVTNSWENIKDIPAANRQSTEMSKALKAYDFNFVGPTICYAFMQATGMVNDHVTSCFRYSEVVSLAQGGHTGNTL